ncbi:hypothetical protein FRB93_006691 [Tulasnella sp. JGI-2019a]|nr:hypothetical protein FRB93_006691 [Tulasnella sp. JGI-2019a]
MVTLNAARAANTTFTTTYRPVALIVGGTSGVGQGIVEAFARATKGNAHIMICGRSETNAKQIISTLPQTANSTYEFIECDVSLMKNVAAVTSAIKARVATLNYLVLTPGMISLKGFTPTDEGIDNKLALHFYSRWKFVDELMPLLQVAKNAGQEARVMTIRVNSAKATPLQDDNLGLKKKYSNAASAAHAITYNNLMVEEYASRYPGLSFIHAHPGFVDSSINRNLHWSVKAISRVFALAATSIQNCGEYMLYTLLSPDYRRGAFYFDSHGELIPPAAVVTSEAARKTLLDHFVKETSTR